MIRHRMVPNGDLVEAERDDFNFWDTEADALAKRIEAGPHPIMLLSAIAEIGSGLTPAKDEYSFEKGPDDGLILKVANLSNAGVRWDDERLSYVSSEFFKKAARSHVQRYDLLVLSAAHQRRYIGKRVDIVDVFPDDVEGNVMAVAELLIIRPNLELINPFYLLAVLRTPTVQDLVTHLVRGQTGHLYPDDIGALRLPVPDSLDVQKSLAARVVGADNFVRRALAEAESLHVAVSAHIDDALYGDTEEATGGLDSKEALGVRESAAVEFRELRDSVDLDPETGFFRVSARRQRRKRGATVIDALDS
jgi:hypothetical protein